MAAIHEVLIDTSDQERIVWYARKPPEATGASLYGEGVVEEEEILETDDEQRRQPKEARTQPKSPSTLADSTAELSLESPLSLSAMKQKATGTTKTPTSIDAFKDSVLSLAAEATAHAATARSKDGRAISL